MNGGWYCLHPQWRRSGIRRTNGLTLSPTSSPTCPKRPACLSVPTSATTTTGAHKIRLAPASSITPPTPMCASSPRLPIGVCVWCASGQAPELLCTVAPELFCTVCAAQCVLRHCSSRASGDQTIQSNFQSYTVFSKALGMCADEPPPSAGDSECIVDSMLWSELWEDVLAVQNMGTPAAPPPAPSSQSPLLAPAPAGATPSRPRRAPASITRHARSRPGWRLSRAAVVGCRW